MQDDELQQLHVHGGWLLVKRALFTLAFLALAATASAEPDKAAAKQAYDRGVAAHERKDYAGAARAFAEADAIAPSAVALQAALDAAVEADDPVLGAELVERSKRGATSGELTKSVDAASKKFAGRAGRIRVLHASDCTTATLDDKTVVDPKKDVWTTKGVHTIDVVCGSRAGESHVDVRGDGVIELEAPTATAEPPRPPPPVVAPPPPPPPVVVTPQPSTKQLRPIWVIAGGSVTVLFGAATIYFGLEAKKHHDDFVSAGCDQTNADGCSDLQHDGRRSQRFTNIAIGIGAVAAVGTVVALFFTDFGPSVAVAPVPGGGVAGAYSGRF